MINASNIAYKVFLLYFLLTIGISTPSQVLGFCCQPGPRVCTELTQSDVVFTGKVISKRDVLDEEKEIDGTYFKFNIRKLYKGSFGKNSEIYVSNDSARMILDPGHEYLIFAKKQKNSDLQVWGCGNSIDLQEKDSKSLLLEVENTVQNVMNKTNGEIRCVVRGDVEVSNIAFYIKSKDITYWKETDINGVFQINVPPGAYKIDLAPSRTELKIIPYDLSCDDPNNIIVKPGGGGDVQFTAMTVDTPVTISHYEDFCGMSGKAVVNEINCENVLDGKCNKKGIIIESTGKELYSWFTETPCKFHCKVDYLRKDNCPQIIISEYMGSAQGCRTQVIEWNASNNNFITTFDEGYWTSEFKDVDKDGNIEILIAERYDIPHIYRYSNKDGKYVMNDRKYPRYYLDLIKKAYADGKKFNDLSAQSVYREQIMKSYYVLLDRNKFEKACMEIAKDKYKTFPSVEEDASTYLKEKPTLVDKYPLLKRCRTEDELLYDYVTHVLNYNDLWVLRIYRIKYGLDLLNIKKN